MAGPFLNLSIKPATRCEAVFLQSRTVYIFAGSKVIAEHDNGAAVDSPGREYVYAGSQMVAKLEDGATTYQHADHLSVRAVSDSSGTRVGEQGHYPFGGPSDWYSTGTLPKQKFTSYERDSESGNDYAMFRSYSNRFGRFSSPDPIAGSISDPQSLNRYAYVRNDPINSVDPTGLWISPQPWHPPAPAGRPIGGLSDTFTGYMFGVMNCIFNGGFAGCSQIRHWISEWEPPPTLGGSLTAEFQKQLLDALNNLSERCKELLPVEGLREKASDLEFYEGRSKKSPDANIRGSDIVRGASPRTVYELADGAAAVVLNGRRGPSNSVIIGHLFGYGVDAWSQATLVHEAMHPQTGRNDADLWKFAEGHGAVKDKNNKNDAWNFTRWLKAGCPDEGKK